MKNSYNYEKVRYLIHPIFIFNHINGHFYKAQKYELTYIETHEYLNYGMVSNNIQFMTFFINKFLQLQGSFQTC